MKRKTASFTGIRPIFTGSPSIVPGGFNLDVASQVFAVGDVVPAGTLAIVNEDTRKVKLVRTAKVVEIDSENTKKVTLYVDESYAPCFAVGNRVLKADAVSGLFADAPTIEKVEFNGSLYTITLSAAITGLAKDDVLVEVVAKSVTTAPVISGVISVNTTTLIVEPGLDITAGDKVMEYPLAEGALIADAKAVSSYDVISGKLVLAAAISDLAAGDKIVKVFADDTEAVTTQTFEAAAVVGEANSVTVADINVSEFETSVDVTADTLQYALFERRVPPIPAAQKDATGAFLKANPHVKLTQSK